MTSIPTNCGEFFELAGQLINTQETQNVSRGLYIYIPLLESIPEDSTTEFYEQISTILPSCFISQQPDIIEPASTILKLCFCFAPELGDSLIQPLQSLIQIFSQLLHTESASCNFIASDLEDIFTSDFPFDNVSQIYEEILQLANDETVSVRMKLHPISLASTLISHNSEIRDKASDLLSVDINFAITSFEQALLNDQEFVSIFIEPITTLCNVCSKYELLDVIIQAIQTEEGLSEATLVAYSLALSEICNLGWEVAASKVPTILNFAIALLHYEGDNQITTICVIESGFDLIIELFSHINPNYNAVQEDVFTVIVNALQLEGIPSLHVRAVHALDYLFAATSISSDLISQSFEILSTIVQTADKDLLKATIETFGSMIQYSKEEILPYAQNILEILSDAANLENEEDSPIKGEAIASLALLIPYIEEKSNFVSLFLQNVSSSDIELSLSSFDAFIDSLPYIKEEFGEAILGALEVAVNLMKQDFEFKDDKDEEYENNTLNRYLYEAIHFCKRAIKETPTIVQQIYEELINGLTKIIDDGKFDEQVMSATIDCAFQAHKVIGQDLSDFLRDLIPSAIEEREIFAELLKSIGRSLEEGIEIQEDVISSMTEAAMEGMRHDLSFQIDDNFDNYDKLINPALTEYFRYLGEKLPQLFPHYEYYEALKKIIDKGNEYDKANYLYALAGFFVVAKDNLEILIKKKIMEMFAQSIVMFTSYEIDPDTISAIREVFEAEPKGMEKYAEDLQNTCLEILSGENNGELFYEDTCCYAISLLLTMQRTLLGENFDVQTFMPLMLPHFPAINDESPNIYMSLCDVCGEFPQQMGQFGPDIAVALGKTLALRDDEFESLNLPTHIFIEIATLFNNLAAANEKIQPMIMEQIGSNNGGIDRINDRLAKAADMIE
ncbi:hypothetical protein TVAG_327700 [Trichomonas vaginalis G3]|uniref:Importin N-terminal domain-containing protein n=1 Tax=Trichomonas vaginalis (strain ATCC PRA-98 / G3) TaxID=412133 RepID=A2G643_TRIV3|nr:armadillo (ARM) repeat-containing protein family [Trichomonas vaginalis G3]EAX87373.1 hypothetical protein TVAG_327700 [Trichomonas vaginalis G3]KAI5545953.1 armadillo (ARM) repeat-containing protein family [Trichomonas vaginalis G3]|eukprot:XP_001300303.1 hypothetical protein [Trichomonas vaginalis G3]